MWQVWLSCGSFWIESFSIWSIVSCSILTVEIVVYYTPQHSAWVGCWKKKCVSVKPDLFVALGHCLVRTFSFGSNQMFRSESFIKLLIWPNSWPLVMVQTKLNQGLFVCEGGFAHSLDFRTKYSKSRPIDTLKQSFDLIIFKDCSETKSYRIKQVLCKSEFLVLGAEER